MPCARNSLLSGIASGAGVGFIRAMGTSMGEVIAVWYTSLIVHSTDPFVASNWAVGTFMVISLGTWYVFTERDGRPVAHSFQDGLPKELGS